MESEQHRSGREFPATLSGSAKLVTYLVGFGVGLAVPAVLGISFAIGFHQPMLLLIPLPFALGLALAWRYRVIGYRVGPEAIAILRPAGPSPIPIAQVVDARFPATQPNGLTIGLARIEGVFGAQGFYWNRRWGRFRAYITNAHNTVELVLRSGSRVLVSPDDPHGFVAAVLAARERQRGATAVSPAKRRERLCPPMK